MMDTKEIQCFVACAQTSSFSKAAEALYTTQSSVSKIIKAMEEKMEITLFERLSKGIRMTPDAEQMYPYALLVLESLEKIQFLDENRAADTLSMSCNPSSWFADNFVSFPVLCFQKLSGIYFFKGNGCHSIPWRRIFIGRAEAERSERTASSNVRCEDRIRVCEKKK